MILTNHTTVLILVALMLSESLIKALILNAGCLPLNYNYQSIFKLDKVKE